MTVKCFCLIHFRSQLNKQKSLPNKSIHNRFECDFINTVLKLANINILKCPCS